MSNREIRFRAWQTVTKTMFYNIEKGTGAPHGNPPFADYLENSNMIIMQYTGLKDKNGKEIYEGDIVSYDAIDVRGIVSWSTTYPGFIILKPNESGAFVVHDEWEVIGNIYETPELIVKEDKS